jgi:hypothetical protein
MCGWRRIIFRGMCAPSRPSLRQSRDPFTSPGTLNRPGTRSGTTLVGGCDAKRAGRTPGMTSCC